VPSTHKWASPVSHSDSNINNTSDYVVVTCVIVLIQRRGFLKRPLAPVRAAGHTPGMNERDDYAGNDLPPSWLRDWAIGILITLAVWAAMIGIFAAAIILFILSE
jgi:hypothetical protein